MRLVSVSSGQPSVVQTEGTDPLLRDVPPYAILSHTWEAGEVNLGELNSPSPATFTKKGFEKIQRSCLLAKQRDNLDYAWVDTCCIDKTSSSELSESINSMYSWYQTAEVCYVYLFDLPPGTASDLHTTMPGCKWFTRGWTLQELIAPKNVVFFDQDWNERGDKMGLSGLISQITGIPPDLLRGETPLSLYSVARRLSWAARRVTTRVEDMSYCLLGIFDVHLSLIYGEGMKAFSRLQEAIILATSDLSIFVWTDERSPCPTWAPLFADEPVHFASCGRVIAALEDDIYRELTITTRGIQVEGSLVSFPTHEDDAYKCILETFCTIDGEWVGIGLRKIGGGRYARYKPNMRAILGEEFTRMPWRDSNRMLVASLTLATRFPPHFPFYHQANPVLGNRNSALRVRWPNTTPKFSVHRYRSMPRSHWDVYDGVFFCANTVSKSWGAYFVHAFLQVTAETCIPVNFFLCCYNWNLSRPKVVIAGLHSLAPATAVFLESQLDRIRFESNRQAHGIVLSVFDGNLPAAISTNTRVMSGKAWVESAVVSTKELPDVFAGWHSEIKSGGDKVMVRLTVDVVEEMCPEICVHPMWRLDVNCEVVQ